MAYTIAKMAKNAIIDAMSKKRVLFVITKGNWGGAQKYVFDLATALPKNSHDVSVAFGVPGKLGEKLTESGIRTLIINSLQRDMNPLLDVQSFFSLYSLFKKERPDVVHLNSAKIGGLGTLAARLAGIPTIIFTAHGWTFNEDRGALAKLIIRFLSWLTILFAHRVIVLGEREYNQALAFPFVTDKKIIKIPLGSMSPTFKDREPARALISQKTGATTQSLWIGTISELHPNKGLTYILDACASLTTPFQFFIIGEGEQRDFLKKYIVEKNLADRIHLLGHIDNASSLLKAFDIFTLTSIKEGLPYVLIEAGYASLPVVASCVGNIPDLITDKKSGLLTPAKGTENISQALTQLISSAELRNEYGQALRTTVVASFSFEKMVEKTSALYS